VNSLAVSSKLAQIFKVCELRDCFTRSTDKLNFD